MEEVTGSNLKLSMPFRSRSVLREQALAAWRFQPSDTAKNQGVDAAWIFQASQQDMEIVTRALERELNSRPDEGVVIRSSNEKNVGPSTSEVAPSSMSSCDLVNPSQAAEEVKASLEVLDSTAKGNRTPPAEALSKSCNNQRSIPAMSNFIGKGRSRRGNRAPITIMTSDTAKNQDIDAAWFFQTSQRDMEIVTRALERELNSRPDEGVVIRTSNEKNSGPSTSELAPSSMSCCDPVSPSQAAKEAKASLEVSDLTAPGIRTPPAEALSRSCNNQRSIPAMNNFIGKRRSRRVNRAPITITRSDTAKKQDIDAAWNFQASQRDMEIVTRALERELNSKPDEGVVIRTSNEKIAGPSTSEVAPSSMSGCDPVSPSQAAKEAKASLEVSDSTAPGNRTPPAEALSRSFNNQGSIPAMNNFIGNSQSRRVNRAPIPIMRSDTAKNQDIDAAWFFQASQRDMEIVTRALERELNSRPDEEPVIRTSNEKNAGPSSSEVAPSSMSSCDPVSPSQAAEETKASLEVSDSTASGNLTLPAEALSRSCNNQRSIPAINNFIGKRRSRMGNRAPITIMRADPVDFQAMVQQMTGFPL
jgi:hypothetical protein